jgi:broad specificity phosphatase PhoE
MQLVLVRHGETDWNSEGRMQGHINIPLNASGIAQANRVAQRLAEETIDALYSSPLARARMTADVIAERIGLVPIWDDRLMERQQGEFEGLTAVEFAQHNPDIYHAWKYSPDHVAIPGEETLAHFQDRVQAFLDQVGADHSSDQQVAIVTHGGTISMILAALIKWDVNRRTPFWFDNVSISKVDLSGSRPRIRLLNDTCHVRNGA